MTRDEKSRIRVFLVSLSKPNILNYRKSIKSPFSAFSFSNFNLVTNFRNVGAAALILILASTGVSFAAEGTLPGDLLYPVKVNVNEEVRGALTTSNTAKMNWEKERVVRRVEETETLIKTKKFTTKRKLQAETALITQMKTFATAAAETSIIDPNAVIAATAELEPALKVHQEVIADIAATAEIQTGETDSILSTVALGITATTEQENVAISSAVANEPDTFANLTNSKIDNASLAIDSSLDNSIESTSELKSEIDLQTNKQGEVTATDINTSKNTEIKSEDKASEQKIEATEDNTDKKIIEGKANTETQTTETLLVEKIISIPVPVIDPKEILLKAKAKLAQAKILRDKGQYREALTLAQEAYKDMVALKLQAKITEKKSLDNPKTDTPKVEIPQIEIPKTEGEVKGVQEIKTETKQFDEKL